MDLVDAARYPIDRLDHEEGSALVDRCAQVFRQTGALVLPGFLTAAAVATIAAEAESCREHAHFCRSEHTVFLDDGTGAEAGNESVRRPLHTRVGSIPQDRLAIDSALGRLYRWPPLTRFIGAVLGHCDFYRGADPLGALSINVYGPGDRHDWHFDESHFSVTIMIQSADQGGHFEYVTGLRSDDADDLDAIGRVLDGDETHVQRLPFEPGALSIFAGRNTLHRVTEVEGSSLRLVPVLTYDTVPGSTNSPAVRKLFWGRAG